MDHEAMNTDVLQLAFMVPGSFVCTRYVPEYLTVAEARARYFSGKLSLRWWYRQIEDGKLPADAGSAMAG